MDGEREKILTRPQRRYLEVLARGGHIEKVTTRIIKGKPNKNPDHQSYHLVTSVGTRHLLGGKAKEAVEVLAALSVIAAQEDEPSHLILTRRGTYIRDTTDRNGYRKEEP